jgi:hypothetical protein
MKFIPILAGTNSGLSVACHLILIRKKKDKESEEIILGMLTKTSIPHKHQ